MQVRLRTLIGIAGLVATTTVSGCGEDEVADDHGYACLDIRRGENTEASVYTGTVAIQVRVNYLQCLRDFYNDSNPEYRLDGVEGERVFTEWAPRLCSEPEIDRAMACEVDVESYTQTLIETEGTSKHTLTITYNLTDPSNIEGNRLLIGPLPLEELAGCGPDVSFTSLGDVLGLNAEGETIWQMQTYENSPSRGKSFDGGCMGANISGM